MKAISSPIIITSIRSRKDGSLGVSLETPELTNEQKLVWLELQGKNARTVISPTDHSESGVVEVKQDIEGKSQSQRLRGVIFVTCKRLGKPEEADKVYYREMENMIDKYKEKLDRIPE